MNINISGWELLQVRFIRENLKVDRNEIFEYVKKTLRYNTGIFVEQFAGQRCASSQKWKMVWDNHEC